MSDQHAANFCVKHAAYQPCDACAIGAEFVGESFTAETVIHSPPIGLDHIASGAPANALIRDAVKRELESELRGLIMAARMHGYVLVIGPEGDNKMVAQVVEGK